MADNYIKRPSDVIDVQFDLRDFVAAVGLQGVAPEDVQFLLRNEPGITITSTMGAIGLIDMSVSGGTMGRVYLIGVEATTPDGDSKVEVSRVRVRDPSLFALLPSDSETTPTGDVIADPAGDLLIDAAVNSDFIIAL